MKKNIKLQLHRDTVRNLEDRDELGRIIGGIVSTDNRQFCGTKMSGFTDGY